MIQIAADNLLVVLDNGQEASFDSDAWRMELREAFHRCAIHEDWMAEHIILSLEEKIRLVRCEEGRSIHEDELRQVLLTMLSVSGYGEVGRALLLARQQEIPLPNGDCRRWSPGEAAAFLNRNLPIGQTESRRLAEGALACLAQWGLPGCSDGFLQELAVLLLHASPSPAAGRTAPPASPSWQTEYISPDFWREHFRMTPGLGERLARGVLRPLPLSDIFPVVRLELNLQKLGEEAGGWQVELALLPELREALAASMAMLAEMRSVVCGKWPLHSPPSRHLLVVGVKQLPTGQRRLRKRLMEAIEQALAAEISRKGDELQLSYR